MSKTTVTHEHAAPESKSHGCCGGDHEKARKTQPRQKEQAAPSNEPKHEHAHQTGGHSGCCGGGKASK
jgi:hypothetical protein